MKSFSWRIVPSIAQDPVRTYNQTLPIHEKEQDMPVQIPVGFIISREKNAEIGLLQRARVRAER
jgi:hypothetical protein